MTTTPQSTAKTASLSERLLEMASPLTLGIIAAVVVTACAAFWLVSGVLPAGVIIAVLLIAVAVVVSFGLFAFSTDDGFAADEIKLQNLADALLEPAVIAGFDGRILAANTAWRDAGGQVRRLPKGEEAPALFVALREAKSLGTGRALVRLGGFDFEMIASRLGEDQVLVRAASQGVLGNGLLLGHEQASVVDETPPIEAFPALSEPGPTLSAPAFEGYSAPFGQALLKGDDVFGARIVTVNSVFARLLGKSEAELIDQPWGALLEATSREEAQSRLDLGKTGPID
ncbi:MAG: PAS domain-containing protein, partial [Asticcacaulis sp.]